MRERDDRGMSFSHIPYLKTQIIPYIGNKRRLLPLILRAVRQALDNRYRGKRFADLFAGSGIVSRFANHLGFRVYANDWEQYSYILNYAYLIIQNRDLPGMFKCCGGIDGMIEHMNTLPDPDEEQLYITRFFSPKDDRNPDYRKERLFYTRYNGLAIDKIRNEIERIYPNGEVRKNKSLYGEKMLLLALLIHQAATHTNTSGVFKAFHKGFGGHAGDALHRILAQIALQRPVLMDSAQQHLVFREDAQLLVRHEPFTDEPFDIAYLDPPYNQHQYGSNYHLLNTIALWDKPLLKQPSSLHEAGKAAIREDWVSTRSDYCYREKAFGAFGRLLDCIDARHIIISYSTEGIIPFDDLITRCAERGRVSLATNEYVKYRGGRQSIGRLNDNIEFVIIVDTRKKSFPADIRKVHTVINGNKLNLQTKRIYSKKLLEKYFLIDEENKRIGFQAEGQTVWIQTRGFLKIVESDLYRTIGELDISASHKERLVTGLTKSLIASQCRDKVHELDETMRALVCCRNDADFFASLLPNTLKKIAHRKYRKQFAASLEKIRELKTVSPDSYAKIEHKILQVQRLACKRFSG